MLVPIFKRTANEKPSPPRRGNRGGTQRKLNERGRGWGLFMPRRLGGGLIIDIILTEGRGGKACRGQKDSALFCGAAKRLRA